MITFSNGHHHVHHFRLTGGDDAHVLMPGRLGKGTWDLFVIEKGAVRCASFR